MNPHPILFIPTLLLVAGITVCNPITAQTQPLHRYSFSETSGTTVNDSIGTSNGVIRGNGALWNFGKLGLPGGSSNSAAYVDLPNGLISGLTDVTIEAWVTIDGIQNWGRIFDFGSSNYSEVTGPGGGGEGHDYFLLAASRGTNANQQRIEIRNEDPAGGGISTADGNLITNLGVEYHHVVTYDADGAGGQARMTYYRDGVLVAQTNTPTQLSQIHDVNNWLGRSNWTADDNLQGSFNEFRIYDTALDQAEITASQNAGPDQLASQAPTINFFTATPGASFEGDAVTLAWNISQISGSLNVSISPNPGSIAGNPAIGSVVVNPIVTTSYNLTATDSRGGRSAEVTIVVDPGIPTANDQSITTNKQVSKSLTLSANDPNNGSLTYAIVNQPTKGTLTGTLPNPTYTPNAGFTGNDSFTFKANDGVHDSNIATVSITVFEAPSAPTNITLSSTQIPSVAISGTHLANLTATDANSQDLHAFTLVAGTGDTHNGLFKISANDLLAQSSFADQIGNAFAIRLRVVDNTGRAFEKAFVLTVIQASTSIVINEIHYNPADSTSRAEFIELHNPGTAPVDLSAWTIDDGVSFTFPNGTSLGAGQFLVVSQDPLTLFSLYGKSSFGPWLGKLDGDGEKVSLRNLAGLTIDSVTYNVGFPWPVASGGDGGSMELLNPALDNDLGSSWRASLPPANLSQATLLPLASSTWSWRPGSTEASSPTSLWRMAAFSEDASWNQNKQSPIGYGSVTGLTINTTVSGMLNNYRCIFARNTFTIAPGEIPPGLQIRSTSDDGIIIWINGIEVDRQRFTGEPTIDGLGSNQGSEGSFDTVTIANAAGFLVEGSNTIAIQLFNSTAGSSDLGFDLEVIRPAAVAQAPAPTPGAQNSVITANAAPNIRQVNHTPNTPASSQPTLITAKVTDPQGVASVGLKFQLIAPGQFLPSRTPRTVAQIMANPEGDPPLNPAFENPANWTNLAMLDNGTGGDILAGDGIFTATIPGQIHRTLVRYRIDVTDLIGATARVPYPDDASLNFAYFVYDGVPDFVASTRSVHPNGAGKIWPQETLTSLPVYHWLINPQDMLSLQAWNTSFQFTNNGTAAELSARRAYDWEGAMVYDGVVYDHIHARLRGGNSRYGDFDGRFPQGKRHYKFKFNRGYYFAAKDENGREYERPWKIFNVSRMFGTKGGNSWGLPEEIGDKLYHTMGVPTQRAHWFHFRVVDGADEAPDQYNGDFWGIQQAQERYDVRFLESHKLLKGNLYKLSDFLFDADSQRRYQAQEMVSDGSEFDNIRFNLHGSQSAAWLNQYVNYEKWFGYSAVGEAIRHYDIFPEPSGRHRLKNLVWYFEPTGADPTRGVCWQLPYDYDASWGPSFNNGWDHANNGLYGYVNVSGQPYIEKPEMKIAHRNVLRSFRDLVWQADQVGSLLDDRAAFISDLTQADQDRWRSAPFASGTATDDPLSFKVQDMKNFAFNGWSGEFPVGAGGRGAFLDAIADNPDNGQLPSKPTISSTGPDGFPTDGLHFQSSPFSDPQGAGTFAALEWRVGEIEDPTAPAWNPNDDFILENDLIWGSRLVTTFTNTLTIPAGALKVGHTYRARVRYQDNTGRMSHWSAPVQFTTGTPTILVDLKSQLMITEIMYHPTEPNSAELLAGFSASDFEYLELQNISDSLTLDLSSVRFTKGVDFDFSSGTITSLAPGEFVLVVANLAAFQLRYGSDLPVAGTWDSAQSLSNSGEQIKLSHGSGTAIHDFIYDDAPPWPTAPDGSGSSLELADPASAPDHALATSWRGGFSPNGSPGRAEIAGPFIQWMTAKGLSHPLDDPDSIGLSNLLVFALGADLLPHSATAVPKVTIVTEEGEQFAAIQFRRRQSASDLNYAVELSSNLLDWSGTTVPFSVSDNGDGTETVTIRALNPIASEAKHYLRLRVNVN